MDNKVYCAISIDRRHPGGTKSRPPARTVRRHHRADPSGSPLAGGELRPNRSPARKTEWIHSWPAITALRASRRGGLQPLPGSADCPNGTTQQHADRRLRRSDSLRHGILCHAVLG